MKKTIKFIFCGLGLIIISSCYTKSEIENRIAAIEKKYQDSLLSVRNELEEAKVQIELLSYPADQRLQKTKDLIDAGELDKAKSEIEQLINLFPNSDEASSSSELITKIEEIKESKRIEEERIKALGFKALTIVQNITIGKNKVSFSNFKIGLKYTHDVYPTYTGSEWREHTADKGCSFMSCNMDVTSSSNNPNIPTIAFYSVEGDKLVRKNTFWVNFARWSDYGSYLGNYPDHKNDFAKVNTVKFRLGAQLENDIISKPYVVVLKAENTLSRYYDRFENPPVSYSGESGYPYTLNLDNFKDGKYVALKVANL